MPHPQSLRPVSWEQSVAIKQDSGRYTYEPTEFHGHFHQFITESDGDGDEFCMAVVETDDGMIETIAIQKIQFTDRK